MSAGKRIIEGAKEALAIARGEQPAASIWHNGFEYVPVARVEVEREACAEIAETIAQGWDVPNDRRPFAACMEIADNIRLRSDQRLAAALPFQTKEAKER